MTTVSVTADNVTANQLIQAGETIYTYDANGNLLSDGEKTYQYDYDNRLISLTEGETTTTYTYDGDGNRLSQSIEAGEEARTHEYIYDINKGLPELIVEIEGENEYIYIYAGRVITQVREDGRAYYHQDGLGSIVLITDEDGEALNRYEYDAFGTPDKVQESIHNPFLFTGEPYDENGLIFLRARYYDPATGRFLTRDTYLGTLDDPLSQHLYVYVANNPVLYVDPSGHLAICFGGSMGHIAYAFNDPDNMIDESGKRPNWVNKLKRFASNLFKATTYFYPPAQYVDAALTGVELSKFHDDVERARYNHAMNVVNIGAGNMEKIAHVPGITIAGNEERYIRHCQIVYRDALCEEMLGKPDLVLGKTWDEMEPHNQKEIVGHMTTWDNRVYRYLSKCHAQNAGYTTYKILLWEVKVNETKPFDNFCE